LMTLLLIRHASLPLSIEAASRHAHERRYRFLRAYARTAAAARCRAIFAARQQQRRHAAAMIPRSRHGRSDVAVSRCFEPRVLLRAHVVQRCCDVAVDHAFCRFYAFHFCHCARVERCARHVSRLPAAAARRARYAAQRRFRVTPRRRQRRARHAPRTRSAPARRQRYTFWPAYAPLPRRCSSYRSRFFD